MSRLRLTLACWCYDRTRALSDGTVVPEGLDLNVLPMTAEELFYRMLRHREFDVAEMSLSSYVLSLASEARPFVAIPVFLSRVFRHGAIFVNRASGIARPEDLAGRRIGVPEYQMTATVWVRGILADEYGVDPASPEYRSGGQEEPGREEKIPLSLPARFRLRPIGPEQTLSRMLAEGGIEALHAARTPSTLATRPDAVRRLFEDPAAVERDYFRRTRIFPIMHLVVIRREVYEANRWIAGTLLKAFGRAKDLAQAAIEEAGAYAAMLPWAAAHAAEARALMGPDWWPYGLDANRHVLDTFLRYHHEQGLSPRRLAPEALFAPETLGEFRL